jgi:hypothetical protein
LNSDVHRSDRATDSSIMGAEEGAVVSLRTIALLLNPGASAPFLLSRCIPPAVGGEVVGAPPIGVAALRGGSVEVGSTAQQEDEYPPAAINAATATLTGRPYGNGVYAINASSTH